MTEKLVYGWGRTAGSFARVVSPRSVAQLSQMMQASTGPVIARGLGRSYGDSAQCAGGMVVDLTHLQSIGDISPDGQLSVGAGVAIRDLINAVLPQGWFVPVTAGTSYVTIGGAIAADIHGKNHHNAGSFGNHVRDMDVVMADGSLATLRPDSVEFAATVGGMGLTGIVVAATIQLIPVSGSTMRVSTRRTRNFDETVSVLAEADQYPYSVAWLDSLGTGTKFGRGVVTYGDHQAESEGGLKSAVAMTAARVTAPPWVPPGLLNRRTVAAFNSAWFHRAPIRRDDEPQSLAEFFYPLDGVGSWNRIYGKSGFVQYQCVVPDAEIQVLREILYRFASTGVPSFLTVLKRFGAGNHSPLSFPISGWTLALDIPTTVADLAQTLDWADARVCAAGGRVYLAKDSRAKADVIQQMYPALAQFRETRVAMDALSRFASDQSRRLNLL